MVLLRYFLIAFTATIFVSCSSEESQSQLSILTELKESEIKRRMKVLKPCEYDEKALLGDLYNYTYGLIVLIDDTTSKIYSDFSNYRYGQSSIPNKKGFIGLKALCLLERLLSLEDSLVFSKEILCERCLFLNKKNDLSEFVDIDSLKFIQDQYKSWYKEAQGLSWDESRVLWNTKYSDNIPKSPLN